MDDKPDECEIISGRCRVRAAEKAGLETVPAFIYAMDQDEAAIMLVDSNLYRRMYCLARRPMLAK